MRREAMLAIGVGEVLWDRLPGGDEIGGAPFNVVSHLARFGYRAAYLTAVGQDPPGDAAIAEMAARGIDTSLVSRADGVPTGLAQVTVGPGGSPAFEIRRPAAFEQWGGGDSVLARVTDMQPSVLVYGTLAQLRPGARDGLRWITAGCPDALALYDVNLRDGWWSKEVVAELLELASVVKLSESEAHELAPVLGVSRRTGASAAGFSEGLATRLGLRGVAVTAGPDAASLWLDGVFAQAAPPELPPADRASSCGLRVAPTR